ncbi:hypothetical protein [Burkholderia sp. BCC1993]|uniref:hypothetical protein n=1 Tax=Burkholderia sp. BCC1993 TaxID=2817444 RepID=UPI002AAF43A1|nr:hypothetical protein [Burkholderia sp. BCC1993]
MPREIKLIGENGGFTCLVPDQFPEVFVDGVSEIQVGMPVSRLLFHAVQVPANGDTPESRIARLSLVIPTAALMEFIGNIAANTTEEVVTTTTTASAAYLAQIAANINRLGAMTKAVELEHKEKV